MEHVRPRRVRCRDGIRLCPRLPGTGLQASVRRLRQNAHTCLLYTSQAAMRYGHRNDAGIPVQLKVSGGTAETSLLRKGAALEPFQALFRVLARKRNRSAYPVSYTHLHRGVSAALFGADRLRLLDLPQWGRAGRNFRLMRMQLMCIIGKNTRYGGGANPADEACCPIGVPPVPTVGNARPAVGKIRVGSVRRRFRGDRCQGYGICNGGMPEGVPRGRRMKVLINLQWCKGCGVCVAFCRSGALSLDGDGKPEYAPALCLGCGLCELYCCLLYTSRCV